MKIKNFNEKILSILLAILIWNYFQFALTETQTYNKIEVKVNPNKNQLITEISKNSITIILEGPQENLNKISNKDFVIEKILPTRINAGIQHIKITPKDVKLINKPGNISIKSVIGKVTLYADNIINKTIKVQPTYESFLNENYEIKAKINNPKVNASGPSLLLKDLLVLKTLPVTVESYNTTSFDKPAFIEHVSNIYLEHNRVTVSFNISEKQAIINLINIPIFPIFLGKQDSLIISKIPNAEITLTLPPNITKKLNPQEDFKLFIEIPQSPSEDESYPIKFMTKIDKLKLKEVSPPKVQVTTKKL